MNRILAESENFNITHEYEKVFLDFKSENKRVLIGDFYGDPQVALISKDERYCVIGGCGLVIYFLKEPYQEYSYNKDSQQWKELFRENDDIWWIEELEYIENGTIEFVVEEYDEKNCGRYKLDVYSNELVRLNKI